jgi:hypothetical protein
VAEVISITRARRSRTDRTTAEWALFDHASRSILGVPVEELLDRIDRDDTAEFYFTDIWRVMCHAPKGSEEAMW